MTEVKLHEITHSRSGDKGDTINISLIPFNEDHYEALGKAVTAELVKEHFKHLAKNEKDLSVIRYPVPGIKAYNFVIKGVLGGDVTTTLRLDLHGKSLSSHLLEIEVELDI